MKKPRGFTLVELVLVISLLGILGLVLGPGLMETVRSYELVRSRRVVLAQAHSALERMTREIRLIPSQGAVLTSAGTQFSFQYPAGTTITYGLSGTVLQRNGINLLPNVSSISFIYYTESGMATVTPSAVRRVRVNLTLDPPGSTGTLNMQTGVFLRNTGNHYSAYDLQSS